MSKKQILNNKESRELLKNLKKGKGKTWEQEIFEREAKEKSGERKAKHGETFSITYTGKILSLNEVKSNHWRKLKPKYDKLKSDLKDLIEEKNPPKFSEIDSMVYYNGRIDLDNTIINHKGFIDLMVTLGYLPDDTKQYVPKISIEYAKDLPKGTIVFAIKERGNLAA